MTDRHTHSGRCDSRWVRSGFWLSLLLLHGAALPSIGSALASPAGVADRLGLLVRLVGLTASALFFVLKVADVRWLRLRPGWRSAVAAVIVVALLHVGVVDRAVAGTLAVDPAPVGVVLFLGSLCHVDILRQAFGLILAILSAFGHSRREPHRRGMRWENARPPALEQFIASLGAPRAPPVC